MHCTFRLQKCFPSLCLSEKKEQPFWFQTFSWFWMLYSFFWAIPRRLNFMCRRFGTLCSIFIAGVSRKQEQTESSETSVHEIRTPENRLKKEYRAIFLLYSRTDCFFYKGQLFVYCPLQSNFIYRVIQEESAILWEMIVCVILSKKVHINMCPILDGYGVMGIF